MSNLSHISCMMTSRQEIRYNTDMVFGRRGFIALSCLVITLLMVRCQPSPAPPPQPSPTTPPTEIPPTATVPAGPATIQIANITIEQSSVGLTALASHQIDIACDDLIQITQSRVGSRFTIEFLLPATADPSCTMGSVFRQTAIALEIIGLETGFYIVQINDQTESFKYDESLLNELTLTSGNASISGLIWHDLCINQENRESTADRCRLANGGGLLANGEREADESGIGQVQVAISRGSCATPIIATTKSDFNGQFKFETLLAGDYCVSIPDTPYNAALLAPGFWSHPANNRPQQQIILESDTNQTEIDFGWDYANLPPNR